MFDQVLGKEEFVKGLTEKGISPEVAEEEFGKILKLFEVGFYKEIYASLNEEEQAKLTEGLNIAEIESDRIKFIEKMREYLSANASRLKLNQDKLAEAVKFAYQTYSALYKGEINK